MENTEPIELDIIFTSHLISATAPQRKKDYDYINRQTEEECEDEPRP